MQQEDLNSNWISTILYYCYQVIPGRCYDINGTDVGTWSYDIDSNLIISTWLPNDISQPSNATLLTYDLNNVLSFYLSHYLFPYNISESQSRQRLTSSEISTINNDCGLLQNEYTIYNTTTNKIMYWNSGTSAFVNLI
jgi:hypothetical protein